MHRSEPPYYIGCPAVRAERPEPVELLLLARRDDRRGAAVDAVDRRAVHGHAVLRFAADDRLAPPARPRGEPQAGRATDAGDGPGGDLPPAEEAVACRAGASHLSVPAARRGG